MPELVKKSVDTAQLLETYRDLLKTVDSLPLLVSGNSMAPFLVHKRDTVYLKMIDRPLRIGDIVLYQRQNGDYILHRICKIEGNTYCMIGDAQTVVESGIHHEQVFARVGWAIRKGKVQKPGRFWWFFFEKIWIRIIPYRKKAQRMYSFFLKRYRGGN